MTLIDFTALKLKEAREGGWFTLQLDPEHKDRPEPHLSPKTPLSWLCAAKEAGANGYVVMALWHEAQVQNSGRIRTEGEVWQRFGVSSKTANDTLDRLELAGLVDIQRNEGRPHIVSIRLPDEYRPRYDELRANTSQYYGIPSDDPDIPF